jgi:hypothetical protein
MRLQNGTSKICNASGLPCLPQHEQHALPESHPSQSTSDTIIQIFLERATWVAELLPCLRHLQHYIVDSEIMPPAVDEQHLN